jgi:hypothetical protein
VTPLLGQWKWDFFHPHNDRLTGGETEVHGRGSPDCSLSGELTEWRNPRIQGFWGGGGDRRRQCHCIALLPESWGMGSPCVPLRPCLGGAQGPSRIA